jgi:CRP-like cAMP-binding protein
MESLKDQYKNQLIQLFPIGYDKVSQLIDENKIEIQPIKQDCLILSEGQISYKIHFVIAGAFRQFSYRKNEEVNFLFYFENDFVFDHSSYLTGQPSIYNIKAIEDGVILCVPKERMMELILSDKEWFALYSQINETAILRLYKRNDVLLTHNPEERYLKLLEVHPKLLGRVPLAKIATFLGITIPSLSRIRKRIASAPTTNLT